MKRFIQGEYRVQSTLLPESLDDYVSDTNPVSMSHACRGTRRPKLRIYWPYKEFDWIRFQGSIYSKWLHSEFAATSYLSPANAVLQLSAPTKRTRITEIFCGEVVNFSS